MRSSIFTPIRAWVQRALHLGPSRLALGLALLLALIALAQPFWALNGVSGSVQQIRSFSWDRVTTDTYRTGAWDSTTIQPYSSTPFSFLAGVLGTAYILDVVYIIVLSVVLALFSMDTTRTMPTLTLLVISLLVVGLALLALFYPVVAVPGAATTDVGIFTVNGFWGSAHTSAPPTDWSWGPGLGWWLLLGAVVLGIVGAALPYLKSVRSMTPARPRAWRPSG